MKQLKSCYKFYNAQGASDTWDNNLGKVRFDINDIVEGFVFEGTEDDLAEIPEVLKSLNELWQESTNQGVLVSERSKKKIEGKAKVMGQGQESRAAAGQGAPASQMLQPPSPRAAADGREKADLPAQVNEGQVPGAGMMRVLEGRAEAVAGTMNAQAVANTQLPAQQAQESPWTHEYSKTHAKCYW